MKNIFVTGSFDNLRSRHIRLMEEASLLGRLTVRLWSDRAAQQLEGLKGRALRKRRGVLLRGHQGAGLAMCAAFVHLEMAVAFGLPSLLVLLHPGGPSLSPFTWMGGEDLLAQALSTLSYAVTIGLIEPFFVGAGFAMYLNRRVEIEAWDVEQSMRHAFAPR